MRVGDRRWRRLPLAMVLTLALTAPAAAQGVEPTTTISRIEAGEVQGEVLLEGALLESLDDGSYLFSDGTGVIEVRVDPPDETSELPLFALMAIEGSLGEDAMEVAEWELLRIVVPAVIVPEEAVIDAFRNWIVAYGSQAPR